MDLSEFKYPTSFKGRYLGFFVLVILQFLNGLLHAAIGLTLVFAGSGQLEGDDAQHIDAGVVENRLFFGLNTENPD